MENSSRRNISNAEVLRVQTELREYREASETKMKELLNRVKELEGLATKRDLAGNFEFKDVIFNATAGSDTEITHNLSSADPNAVRAIPVMWQFLTTPVDPPYIYKSVAANSRPWGPGYIILRCNIASAAVRMLLITESR